MKVLLTGGAGYIGSHVANNLVDAGHKASSDGIGIALIECVEDFLRKYTKIETTEQTHIL